MYSPLQIEIIKLLGSKELSSGCFIKKINGWNDGGARYGFCIGSVWEGEYLGEQGFWLNWNYTANKYKEKDTIGDLTDDTEIIDTDNIEILGHLPTLESLFIKAEEKGFTCLMRYNYLKREYVGLEFDNTFGEDDVYALIPYNPKLKPYQQTEETMQEILNLFK